MASMMFRDGGGGRRRGYASFGSVALCLLLISTLMAGCNLDSPTSPNDPGDLTGQTTNQSFTFSGTIGLTQVSGTVVADDMSTVTIIATVRDASGNPVPNLTTVSFSTDLGGFLVGEGLISPVATAVTFNGQAAVDFLSLGRETGTATIRASLGTVSAATNVVLFPAPVEGSISASFGSTGTGGVTMTGVASTAVPLDVAISAAAVDEDGIDPIVGATVRFRILTDTTDEQTTNEPVDFIGGVDTVTTNSDGVAATQIRVLGPGDVVIIADLIDPNTGALVSTSNTIILVTTQGTDVPSLDLLFDDGSTVADLGGTPPAPESIGVVATATSPTGAALSGYTVRFFIQSDTTGGAYLGSTPGTTSTTSTTGGDGTATVSLTLTTTGQTVVVGSELRDPSGNVVAVSNDVVASYD